MMKPRRRILVIDDNAEDLEVIRRHLLRDGNYHNDVAFAESGPAGLALCQQDPPDAVLLDQHMPQMEGLEVLRRLRSLPDHGGTVPVVFLTGSGYGDAGMRAIVSGAQDYLAKDHITAPILSRALSNAIAKAQMQAALQRAAARAVLLQEALLELSRAQRRDELVEVILRAGLRAVGAAQGFVGLLSKSGAALEIRAAVLSQPTPPGGVAPWHGALTDPALPLVEVLRSDDVMVYTGDPLRPTHPPLLMVPLCTGDRLVGAMGFCPSGPREPDSDERSFLKLLAGQCAQALERARLYEEGEHRAAFEARLVALVSHDLKQPITAIARAVALLLPRAAGDAQLLGELGRIAAATQQAGRAVDELLDLARAEEETLFTARLARGAATPPAQ